jgi:hypothetical protein
MNYQEQLYAEYKAKASAPAEHAREQGKAVDEKKIMELMQQGKADEARALAMKAVEAAQQAGEFDPWPLWSEYFEKLEPNAYATLIIIEPTPKWAR